MFNIAVIGAGSWGTALSILLSEKGYKIKLWVHSRQDYDQIKYQKENIKYLPGIKMNENILPILDINETANDTDLIIMAVPSHHMRETAQQISKNVKNKCIVVSVSKGIENNTFLRLSEIIKQEIPQSEVCVLSGPSHAEEVSRQIPTAVVSASSDLKIAGIVQDVFISSNFRVYTSTDITGVEIGGALKNIIALGAGISDGLSFGDNTKAALMTRGIVEIARFGRMKGANPATFSGLSGIGDLIVTCTSMHSRNRRAGILIGKGMALDTVLESIGMVVEGVKTCEAVYALSVKSGIEMPITAEIYNVLFNKKNPRDAVMDLMLRDKKFEYIEDFDVTKSS